MRTFYLKRLEIGRTSSTMTPTVINPHPLWTSSTIPSAEPSRMKATPMAIAIAGNADARLAKIAVKTDTGRCPNDGR